MNRFTLIILLAGTVFVSSCDKDKNHPGYTYFPDMAYSRAYETYSENPNFENNSTFRIPAEGTVPRGFTPFTYPKNDEGMAAAGRELSNPFEVNADNLLRGKEAYDIFCLHCHGELGDGKGYLYTSGRYPYPPATLVSDKMIDKPQGEFYHQITLGWGIMGAHGSMIREDDRWKIIMYVKEKLQEESN
jgi:mono/diheme cytochrome c family protein